MENTYEMDSVSLMFPSLGGHLYRMTAVFNETVDIELLKKALPNLANAFPIMFTHLDKTYSGYIHRSATNYDVISKGEKWINSPDLTSADKPAFRIYVDDNLFSVDFFHGNADGHIAKNFMAALVDSYCALVENKPMPILSTPNEIDLKDPYKLYYKRALASSVCEKPSYVLNLKRQAYDYHRLACFSMDVKQVKQFTKDYGCSINDLLCSMYYKAIVNATMAKNSDKDVTISVGIDLRSFYKSNTQRNFDYYCNVRFSKDCKNSFDNTIKSIQKQIKESIKDKNVKAGIASVHDLAYNPLVKAAPRVIKDPIMRASYHAVYDNGITSTLSNIGYQKSSDDSKKHLDRIEVYLNIFDSKVNAAAVGCKDKLTLNLTYNSKDNSIDNEIAKLLKDFGLKFKYTQREFY